MPEEDNFRGNFVVPILTNLGSKVNKNYYFRGKSDSKLYLRINLKD